MMLALRIIFMAIVFAIALYAAAFANPLSSGGAKRAAFLTGR